MNKTDVFLSDPLVDQTEQKFLARLRRDLERRGIRARVLANLVVGRRCLQLDFVIITPARVVTCELKGQRQPLIATVNGPWRRALPNGRHIKLPGNAYRQAHNATYALSDSLHEFASTADVPAAPKGTFVKSIDTVVCVYPKIPRGSRIDRYEYVTVVGYDQLLDRLELPGPDFGWEEEHWDGFVRHLGLYMDGDTADRAREEQDAMLDDYRRRFVAGHADVPPRAAGRVLVDGVACPEPDLFRTLTEQDSVLLLGPSGAGKSHLARHAAVEFARAGGLPIWLDAYAYDGSFEKLLAQATAHHAIESPQALLAAARATGATIAVFVDGLNECSEKLRSRLLRDVGGLQLQTESGVVLTAQQAYELPEPLAGHQIELLLPDEEGKAAVLDAYGARALLERSRAFTTPYELSLAAECKTELGNIETRAELLDAYVRRATHTEPVRAAVRRMAWVMHMRLTYSMRVQDVLRMLQGGNEVNAADAEAAIACPLVVVRHGLATFAHEEIARFLAAEALLLDAEDTTALVAALREPRHANLRADLLALEADEARLTSVLPGLDDGVVLLAASRGELGARCERVADSCLERVLDKGLAATHAEGVEYVTGEAALEDRWRCQDDWSSAERVALSVVGQRLHDGAFQDRVVRLLERTDTLCRQAMQRLAEAGERAAISRVVGTTYALIHPDRSLPASLIVQACQPHPRLSSRSSDTSGAAASLLALSDSPSWGVLYTYTLLFDGFDRADLEVLPEAFDAAWQAGGYHLQLQGLQAVERAVWRIEGSARERLIEVIPPLTSSNIFLNSSIAEVQAAYGLIEPVRDVESILEEIRRIRDHPDLADPRKLARSIVHNRWEDERIIGPYSEAIASLPVSERVDLLVLALEGSDPDDLGTDIVLHELVSEADVSRNDVRDALVRFARAPDPSSWFMPQHGIRNHLVALRACAKFCSDPPCREDVDAERKAWSVVGELVFWLEREKLGHAVGADSFAECWRSLLGDLRPAAAEPLYALWSSDGFLGGADEPLHPRFVSRFAPELRELATWSLEHCERLVSTQRFVDVAGRGRYLIDLLAQVGDESSLAVLRGLANDADLGQDVTRAVRDIEARHAAPIT
jgi:hypothetical protein